jgi:hypothetical protein
VRSIPTGARLFAAALAVYCVCPPFTGYDSYYVVPTVLSLIRHGSTAVDEFVPDAPPVSRYAVECVPPKGPAVDYGMAAGCPGGHWYNAFPMGVPILAALPVAAIAAGTSAVAALAPATAAAAPHPIIASFLSADLVGGNAIVELLCGALFGALAVWVMYHVLRQLLPQRAAVWVTLLFAFGTPEWSIGSRNLTQHGLTILLLNVSLYIVVAARERPELIRYLAIPLSIAFTVRPSAFIPIVVLTLYVALHYRAEILRYLAWAAPAAGVFFAYYTVVRHSPIPRYYDPEFPDKVAFALGFPMHWVSPSRGMLVFTPVFLFSLLGIYLIWRNRWLYPLSAYIAAIVLLHSLLIARYFGGHSYGPRYFSDMSGLFVFLLVPAVLMWQKVPAGLLRSAAATLFVILALFGVFVHFRGATSIAAIQWSAVPVSVDDAKWRVWDWSDPQFLRGLR